MTPPPPGRALSEPPAVCAPLLATAPGGYARAQEWLNAFGLAAFAETVQAAQPCSNSGE